MSVNYDDKRFTQVESDKNQALSELEKTYGNMINESDSYYQAQIDASKEWADKQTQLQQEQTDHAIGVIEQEKDKTTKDYKKEQSGAYVDWQKESNRYGANAEYMAANGLAGSGYSESSQVSMYNTYQNRVAVAREAWTQAIQNYNNKITEARLQNNAILAEIAYNALQQQLELSLAGFQYKNDLIREQQAQKQSIENTYYARYQDVLDQINQENALAEEIRQFNAQLAEEKRQYNESLAFQKSQAAKSSSGGSYSIKKGSSGGSSSIKKSSGGSGGSKFYPTSKSADDSGKKNTGGGGRKFGVSTDYYNGTFNSDVDKYGTFSNGYQPKGISGHGTLSKTGQTIDNNTQTLSGEKRTVTQNVWKAEDGTKWYWEGRQNKYIQIK